MIEPINARTLISNGWNIKNRRLLQQRIGKVECAKLYDAYSRINQAGDTIPSLIGGYGKVFLKNGAPILTSKKQDIKLLFNVGVENLKTKLKHPLTFFNEDISIQNINKTVTNIERGARKSYNIKFPPTVLESETLKTLFSPKYAPKKRTDSKGYAVTTVIDNQTKEPVEVYVKCISKTPKTESWGIYTKDGDNYKEIGYRSFGVNNIEGEITPGYMNSTNNDKRYSGIGLRLHQIAIERMMQNGFDTISIESVPDAFAFHYKAGFRTTKSLLSFTKDSLDSYINIWSQATGIPTKTFKQEIISNNIGSLIFVDNKTLENFFILKVIKNGEKFPFNENGKPALNMTMTLPKEWLETWKTMAQLQPILL